MKLYKHRTPITFKELTNSLINISFEKEKVNMPITSNFSIFSSRYNEFKIKAIQSQTISPIQKFNNSPPQSTPISSPPPSENKSPKSPKKSPEKTFNPYCYFSRSSINELQVGDIIKYNQKGENNICKVIKISPSKKSFKKIDGILSDSGIFSESGIPNLIDKDTLVSSRKIFKMHNFKKNTWRKNLLFLINLHFKKDQEFTTPEVYEKCERILQQVYPKSKTIRASIQGNLQFLRDEKYIKFKSLGKYVLL